MYGTGASYYSFCNDFHGDFNAYNCMDNTFLPTETNCRSFPTSWEMTPQTDAGGSVCNVSPFVFPYASGRNSFTVYQDFEQPKLKTYGNNFTEYPDLRQSKVKTGRNCLTIYDESEQPNKKPQINSFTVYQDLEQPKRNAGCEQAQLLSCSSLVSSSFRPVPEKNVVASPHHKNEISRDVNLYCFGNLNSLESACSGDSSRQNRTRHHYCPSYAMNSTKIENHSTGLISLNCTAGEKALQKDWNYSCMLEKQNFDCVNFMTVSPVHFNNVDKTALNSTDFHESCAKSVKRSRRHIPHALRPTDAVVRRNNREKRRIGNVNAAFEVLRRHTPLVKHNKKAPKISVLRQAARYIAELSAYLANTQETALTSVSCL